MTVTDGASSCHECREVIDTVDISTCESAPVQSFRLTLEQLGFGKQVAKCENSTGNIPTSPRGGSRNMEQTHTSQAALISGDSTLADEDLKLIPIFPQRFLLALGLLL